MCQEVYASNASLQTVSHLHNDCVNMAGDNQLVEYLAQRHLNRLARGSGELNQQPFKLLVNKLYLLS